MNGNELEYFHREEKEFDKGMADAYILSEPAENHPYYLAGWHVTQRRMDRDNQRLRRRGHLKQH